MAGCSSTKISSYKKDLIASFGEIFFIWRSFGFGPWGVSLIKDFGDIMVVCDRSLALGDCDFLNY